MSTRLADLTEPQILEVISKNFEHDALARIDTRQLINTSGTLDELIIEIATAIELE